MRISEAYWVIIAVCKHVVTQDTLAGAGVGVGINEPAQFGIVITGLEIVERGLDMV